MFWDLSKLGSKLSLYWTNLPKNTCLAFWNIKNTPAKTSLLSRKYYRHVGIMQALNSLWRDSRMLASTWRVFLRQLILLHVIFMSWTPGVCRNPPYKRHWSISNPLRVAWAGNPQTNNINSTLTSCFNLPFQLKSSINFCVHKKFLNTSHLNLKKIFWG